MKIKSILQYFFIWEISVGIIKHRRFSINLAKKILKGCDAKELLKNFRESKRVEDE